MAMPLPLMRASFRLPLVQAAAGRTAGGGATTAAGTRHAAANAGTSSGSSRHRASSSVTLSFSAAVARRPRAACTVGGVCGSVTRSQSSSVAGGRRGVGFTRDGRSLITPRAAISDSSAPQQSRVSGRFENKQDLNDEVIMETLYPVTTPVSVDYQQTLRRSFILTGVGLHSGEYEVIRVCPAYAGEGRYFVRVPPGTIDWEEEAKVNEEINALTDEEVEEKLMAQLHNLMSNDLEVPEEQRQRAEALKAKKDRAMEDPFDGKPGEHRIPAHIDHVLSGLRLSTRLELNDAPEGSEFVGTIEHLLSAFEGIGVDNVRVEVEGTGEIPILEGSAYPFIYEVAKTGVVPAPTKGGDTETRTPRMAWKPKTNIMVQEGDAFVMLNVDKCTKLTYGIDFTYKSRAIGKQWESWTPLEDGSYEASLSRARTFGCMQDIMAYYRAGHIKGGTEHCALVAHGDHWWNPPQRMPNEPARHKMLDLIGDLSLLATPGNMVVPIGHIVAYKAGHELHAKFSRAVKEAIERGDVDLVPAEVWFDEEKKQSVTLPADAGPSWSVSTNNQF